MKTLHEVLYWLWVFPGTGFLVGLLIGRWWERRKTRTAQRPATRRLLPW